jgi:hypothetical protein
MILLSLGRYQFHTAASVSDKWSNMFNFVRRNCMLVSPTANKGHFSAEINNFRQAEMLRHPKCEIFQVLITNRKSKHIFDSEPIYHHRYNNHFSLNFLFIYLLTRQPKCQLYIKNEEKNKIKQTHPYTWKYNLHNDNNSISAI